MFLSLLHSSVSLVFLRRDRSGTARIRDFGIATLLRIRRSSFLLFNERFAVSHHDHKSFTTNDETFSCYLLHSLYTPVTNFSSKVLRERKSLENSLYSWFFIIISCDSGAT